MGNRSVLYEINFDLSTGGWGVSCPTDQNGRDWEGFYALQRYVFETLPP
jgi:hypothetical protein